MKKLVVAVIGCGRISDIAHFPALSKIEDARVKYAIDLIPEKAEAMKAKYPVIERTGTDYRVALADPEVDAVYVLTPNYVHYTVTMDALRAGKHVFCEKPITVSYALSKEMKDEADKTGRILNIGVCNRYHKSVEEIERLNREGVLGNIYTVYCSFRSGRSIPGLGGPFTTKKMSGGGVLIDWGVHFLDLILYILGGAKIKTVSADAYSEMAKKISDYVYDGMWAGPAIANGTNDVEDYITGYIRTDKASISFNGAWAQNIFENEMYIDFMGDKAGIRLKYCSTFTLYSIKDGKLAKITPEYEIPNMYEAEDRAFIESVRTGVKTRSNIDSVLESARLLDLIYRSAELGMEIKGNN
jgi:predicted dehydrogenase